MSPTEALAEVHSYFCAKDGTHDDACTILNGLIHPIRAKHQG